MNGHPERSGGVGGIFRSLYILAGAMFGSSLAFWLISLRIWGGIPWDDMLTLAFFALVACFFAANLANFGKFLACRQLNLRLLAYQIGCWLYLPDPQSRFSFSDVLRDSEARPQWLSCRRRWFLGCCAVTFGEKQPERKELALFYGVPALINLAAAVFFGLFGLIFRLVLSGFHLDELGFVFAAVLFGAAVIRLLPVWDMLCPSEGILLWAIWQKWADLPRLVAIRDAREHSRAGIRPRRVPALTLDFPWLSEEVPAAEAPIEAIDETEASLAEYSEEVSLENSVEESAEPVEAEAMADENLVKTEEVLPESAEEIVQPDENRQDVLFAPEQMIRYYAALDQGDFPEASALMHELEERRKELPRTLYPMMARELAFCALLDGDAERAAVMIERSRRVRYYWTNADNDRLAAYFAYHARQDAEGALEICRQLTGGQRPGVSGRYIMDAELAEQLKTLIINSENLE